jgi:hypothetical protein
MFISMIFLTPSGHVYILKRKANGASELIHAIQARGTICSVKVNNIASIIATVCYWEGKVELWDVEKGVLVCLCAPMFIAY